MEEDMRIFNTMSGLNGETSECTGFIYRSASDMLVTVADGKGNVNVSPISLWLALALAAHGGHGAYFGAAGRKHSAPTDCVQTNIARSSSRSTNNSRALHLWWPCVIPCGSATH